MISLVIALVVGQTPVGESTEERWKREKIARFRRGELDPRCLADADHLDFQCAACLAAECEVLKLRLPICERSRTILAEKQNERASNLYLTLSATMELADAKRDAVCTLAPKGKACRDATSQWERAWAEYEKVSSERNRLQISSPSFTAEPASAPAKQEAKPLPAKAKKEEDAVCSVCGRKMSTHFGPNATLIH